MPNQHSEFARDCDDRDGAVLTPLELGKLVAQRTWVLSSRLSSLDQQPACIGITLFGDVTVIDVLCALAHARHQSQIGGELFGRIKALNLSDRSHERVSN